jgi:hypothetical protein
LVKAAALAMVSVPDVNGAWMDTFVRRYQQVGYIYVYVNDYVYVYVDVDVYVDVYVYVYV